MAKIEIGQALQIVANLGVLIGILLLVYELGQTRQLALAQFEIDRDVSFQSVESVVLGANFPGAWEKSIVEPESLSAAEIRVLDSFYAIQVSRMVNTWNLEQSGLVSPGRTKRSLTYNFPYYFGNSFSHIWWSYERDNWPSEFVELVDEVLAGIDQAENKMWLTSLMGKLKELESP